MSENDGWLPDPVSSLYRLQCWDDFSKIMTIDFAPPPTEPPQDGRKVHSEPRIPPVSSPSCASLVQPTKLLQSIPIENGSKISNLVSRCDMQCFPGHSLLQLAVANQDERLKTQTFSLRTNRKPESNRQSHSQLSGCSLHAW